MSIDKLAPQSVEAEQSVLGSILIDADAILRVGDFLKPGDFYRQQHGEIYEAMLALHGQREPIDLVTLGDELGRRDRLEEVGGPAYLATLMNSVPTAVHAEHYGRIVERKSVLRNLIGAAGKIAAVGYEEANDAEVAIDRAGRTAASSPSPCCWARRTTGSSTSTSTEARSSACRPGCPSSTRCSAGCSRPT
jgi:replicative DNA helicase